MPDIRNEKTEKAIKDAFLDLLSEKPLKDIGMSEIARRAGISRSTLYSHYENTRDLFEGLVLDFLVDVRGLRTQLRCGECQSTNEKRPFCMAVRAAGPFQPLVLAPEFLPTYLDTLLSGPNLECALAPYLENGATREQARALFIFQMTGCYAAATMQSTIMWEESQRAIDQFIRGGFASLKSL